MNDIEMRATDPNAVLARLSGEKSELKYQKHHILYSQGNPADSVFYVRSGKAKMAVVSPEGKEAVIGILQPGDFLGQECLSGHERRMTTVTTLTECAIVRLEKSRAVRALHEDPEFSDLFISYLMARNIRVQEDHVDLLFNSTEKRLARLLLILANYAKEDSSDPIAPKINQEMLAEMIGTSRSHVSFFMNKFRHLGFIDYRCCDACGSSDGARAPSRQFAPDQLINSQPLIRILDHDPEKLQTFRRRSCDRTNA